MSNNEIRQELLKKRWNISEQDKSTWDSSIKDKLIKIFSKMSKNKFIGLYWPIENEVDTIKVIKWLISNQYKVCIPKIKEKQMYFVEIKSIDFKYEYWHSMKQPTNDTKILGNQISLLIVPLVGFNKDNYRMGYGMNFYNDYLLLNHIQTIGIAYSFQKNDNITITNRDIKLNKIITE